MKWGQLRVETLQQLKCIMCCSLPHQLDGLRSDSQSPMRMDWQWDAQIFC